MLAGLPYRQYIRACREAGLAPAEYQSAPYPQSSLMIWIECRRYANPLTGATALPDPLRGGWLDQDAELMLAFEILDEILEENQEQDKKRGQLRDQASTFFQGAGLPTDT